MVLRKKTTIFASLMKNAYRKGCFLPAERDLLHVRITNNTGRWLQKRETIQAVTFLWVQIIRFLKNWFQEQIFTSD